MLIIKTLDFLSRLDNTFFLIRNTIEVLNDPQARDRIFNKLTAGSKELTAEILTKSQLTPEQMKDASGRLHKGYLERMRKQVNAYVPVLVNQGLVMLCTVLEIYFVHVLDIIMQKQKSTMITLAQKKNIELGTVIELGKYEAIIDDFRDKIREKFSREGIKDKFDDFEKVGLETAKVFDLSLFQPKPELTRYVDFSLEGLVRIFAKRHDIVHKNIQPIKTWMELASINELFNKIIWNLSLVAREKFKAELDMFQFLHQRS